MAFRLGLTSEPFVGLRGVRVRDDVGASTLVLACLAAPLHFASGFEGTVCLVGGERLLLMPSWPRFMILAGVTGMSG